jgi:hypothetical protein
MEDEIKFTVFDKDILRSDIIGAASLKVGALCTAEAKKRWLNLYY